MKLSHLRAPRALGPGVDRFWGQALAVLDRSRRLRPADLLVIAGVVGLIFALTRVRGEWTGVSRTAARIDLSPAALPLYTLLSLSRGLFAYALSFAFTLVYGFWAAHDRLAERFLIPLLDILQSIPVLGFMPGLVLALVAIFPHSNVGLELAAVVMIFTGQVWNMTFSFYHSLRSIPESLSEAGTVYRFNWWQRFRWVEFPTATVGLVWNSMMSMAGGWFFLMINEAFVLGEKDFRLPGLGSYMSVAVAKGDARAMAFAIVAMILMIVALDQLVWRPVVAWSQRFKAEDSADAATTTPWFLEVLRRSRVIASVRWRIRRLVRSARAEHHATAREVEVRRPGWATAVVSKLAFVALLACLAYGAFELWLLLRQVSWVQWGSTAGAAGLTLARVLASTALGTLWALPAGLAIGLSPRLGRFFQPVVQVAASFPAPMLFPAVIAVLGAAGVPLGWGSILLMLLGTQWYILFNVIAGASAIPADLREAARSYRFTMRLRLWRLYLPAVFPYLVTGWVTAAGGAWNASIVSEFVTFRGRVMTTTGIGASISRAAEQANYVGLAAGIVVMSTLVVVFNRVVWRRCYGLASTRFALNR
jgi:NitT/TauT family transport system permease protein